MKLTKLYSAIIGVTLLFLCLTTTHAQVIAIRAGKLIDTETGTAATNQIILVESGKIKAVGAGLPIPAGASVIDLSNYTILAGPFDAHTHLCQTTSADNRDLFTTDIREPTAYRAILGVANAKQMLESGFTTVRDVGNNGNYADTALRHAIENGLVPGPTMINAGRIIAPFGGQYHLQPDRPELGNPEYLFADTHDEMIKAIRQNIHFGSLVIKIVVDDQKYIYSADDIKVVEEETRGKLENSYIDSFVEAGIPARDILKTMTTNAAALLGVEKQRGAIKPGMFADIVATHDNPLDNIQALKTVSFVMKNGTVIRQSK